MLPIKTVNGIEYSPEFLAYCVEAWLPQRQYAVVFGNTPMLELIDHTIAALNLYSEALRDPDNHHDTPKNTK